MHVTLSTWSLYNHCRLAPKKKEVRTSKLCRKRHREARQERNPFKMSPAECARHAARGTRQSPDASKPSFSDNAVRQQMLIAPEIICQDARQ